MRHLVSRSWNEGLKPGGSGEDRINYQVMGTNAWQHEPSLDAMRTESYRLHLTSDSAGRHMRLSQAEPGSPGFVRQVVNLADRTTSGNGYYPSEITSQDTSFTSGLTFVSEPFAEAVQVNGAFRHCFTSPTSSAARVMART